MKKLPSFETLLAHFPAVDAPQVKALVGGDVNADYITNTCVVRVSRSLNYAGDPISARARDLWTLKGGDGKRYALRVKEFHRYMLENYGKPTISASPGKGAAGVSRLKFFGTRGIMMFDVRGWSDATGHFDLWNGLWMVYHGYFEKASKVHLWACDT